MNDIPRYSVEKNLDYSLSYYYIVNIVPIALLSNGVVNAYRIRGVNTIAGILMPSLNQTFQAASVA